MDNKQLLDDAFNMYYKKAKADHASGNLVLAKRNYLLAAETLMKLAKTSPTALQKAQFDRAKRLVEIADNLEITPARASIHRGGVATAEKSNDDEKKEFSAAIVPDISFNDIVGLEDVKRSITIRMINPIKYPEQYKVYDKKTGGGVLLYGPPGTGKTMIAKAIAHEVGAKFYVIKGSDIVSKWVGESERNINALFEQARNDDRAIIFIDEMDSLFGQRGSDPHNDKRVNEFLQQIDGFAGSCPNLLLLGATNRPWDVDGAAVRSGRFSQKIYIPLPDAPARKALFEKYSAKTPLDADVDFDELVKLAKDCSGADIAEICDRAKEIPLETYIKSGSVVKVRQANYVSAIRSVSTNVDHQEIARFEKYAGVKHTQEIIQEITPEPINNAPAKVEGGKNEIILANSVISLLPNERPRIEFALAKPCDKVYLVLDTQHYICTRRLNNYITDEVAIDEPGTYIAKVFCGNEPIAECEITFFKGIQEKEFDI